MLHEITVSGIVQGVGFRPFLYRLADRFGLSGEASNTTYGVRILVASDDRENLERFVEAIRHEHPPLAVVRSVKIAPADTEKDFSGFAIAETVAGSPCGSMIPPDIATCPECLKELLDPSDRRYLYPFINCTDCGPRFTITRATPYDRPFTSMNEFAMCPECLKEYGDPSNRRFHAEPNGCAACGPEVSWHDSAGNEICCADPVSEAVLALKNGACVAIKGLGGFHLAVDASSDSGVALLRERKQRPHKPFAIMARDIEAARRICRIDPAGAAMLASGAAPVLLFRLKERASALISRLVAPFLDEAGIMLPYTPLHHMIFRHESSLPFLVMTSGNRGGEPICSSGQEAFSQLGSFADFFLLHNRKIVNRVDDSVARAGGNRVMIIRRARGYVPGPVELVWKLPAVLACGADLKNTFCLARGHSAMVGQHCGDLYNTAALDFYMRNIEGMKQLSGIIPDIAACDLHPDYMSCRYAESTGLPLARVQHHHAHAVAVMAEHGLSGPLLAVVLDGAGYGDDGTVWGGEILLATPVSYRRLARLEHIMAPGGDTASREIWRLALSVLFRSFGTEALHDSAVFHGLREKYGESVGMIVTMLERGINSPPVSSCGRLFDAVASILGLRHEVSYEGQAAMELEAVAGRCACGIMDVRAMAPDMLFPVRFSRQGGLLKIHSSEMIRSLAARHKQETPVYILACLFHEWLASSFARATVMLAREHDICDVVLTGGCFQNRLLFERVSTVLAENKLNIFTGVEMPVNDGGISLGQSVVAGLRAAGM